MGIAPGPWGERGPWPSRGGFWGQRMQDAGRRRGGRRSRQGIDSRTNACNFITNLGTSVGGHWRGCSPAVGGLRGWAARQGLGAPYKGPGAAGDGGAPPLLLAELWGEGGGPRSAPLFLGAAAPHPSL